PHPAGDDARDGPRRVRVVDGDPRAERVARALAHRVHERGPLLHLRPADGGRAVTALVDEFLIALPYLLAAGGKPGDLRAREPLHADGMIFRLPDGTPWRWKGLSMFRALQ